MKSLVRDIRKMVFTSAMVLAALAKQDSIASSWIPLSDKISGVTARWNVKAGPIAAKDGILYAVYYAEAIGGGWERPEIRRYDTCSDSWDQMTRAEMVGRGGGAIEASAVDSDFLYVGGQFETIGGVMATNIAKCQLSTGTWSPVGGNGLALLTNKTVIGIAPLSESNVYVILQKGSGDEYDTGVDTELVKQWNGSSWVTVGRGLQAYGPPGYWDIYVSAITTDGANIYVGGYFAGGLNPGSGGVNSFNVIKWNPNSQIWELIGDSCSVIDGGNITCVEYLVTPNISALAYAYPYLYITGNFAQQSQCCMYNHLNYPRGLVVVPASGGPFRNVAPNIYLSYMNVNGNECAPAPGNGLASDGTTVWLGGSFDSVSCTPSGEVVSLTGGGTFPNLINVASAGAFLTNAGSLGSCDRIAVDQYSVYIGGGFDNVSPSGLARKPLQVFPSGPCMGKIGWWRMNGNEIDSAMGHDGSIVNSFEFTTGKYGTGIHTSGKPAGLQVDDAPGLNFGTGDFTLEAWVKPENANTAYDILNIIDKRVVTGTVVGYELALTGGKVIFQMGSTSGERFTTPGAGNDLRLDGNWHHVAVTVQRNSATGGKLYVDGAQVGDSFSTTTVTASITSTAPLMIGLHPDVNLDCNFRGRLDEPGVYSRALSASEIAGIYSAGKQCSGCLPANAVAWWPLEGDGNDIVGGYNGVVKQTFEFQPQPPDPNGQQYIQLNGKAGGLNVSDAPDLNFGTSGDFTIYAWIKAQALAPGVPSTEVIVDKRVVSGTVVGYEFGLFAGKINFQMAAGGQSLNTGGIGNSLRDNNWHHVAVTVQRNSSTGVKLYVDGAQVGTSFNPTAITSSITSTAPLLIGMYATPNVNGNFRGGIDEVVMYNRAVSATEIQSVFNAGHP